jgi:uncharacterized repeat protein (TIGR03847 family)
MARQIELNPVTHITIGTVGPPGERVFYLQGGKHPDLITLKIEKQQAILLASSLETLLEELGDRFPSEDDREPVWTDMRLHEPIEPLFRVGNIGLGFSAEVERVAIVAYELVDEEEEPNAVSLWANRIQIQSLIQRARDTAAAGRPIWGNCGQTIDADGHFCPNRNGHTH